MKGYKTGGRQQGTPNKISARIKDRLGDIIELTLDSIDINEFSGMEKIKLLQALCHYVLPKQKQVYNDVREDVPLFIEVPKKDETEIIDSLSKYSDKESDKAIREK